MPLKKRSPRPHFGLKDSMKFKYNLNVKCWRKSLMSNSVLIGPKNICSPIHISKKPTTRKTQVSVVNSDDSCLIALSRSTVKSRKKLLSSSAT